jgi:alanine-glyoxylate transaminase/serine-glyoxylate transaminase/serine-pyruvate transaminase
MVTKRVWYSDTVTTIFVPEGFDANDVIKTAYYRYDLSLGTGLNKLNEKAFRIGHLGWLNEIMVMQARQAYQQHCRQYPTASAIT